MVMERGDSVVSYPQHPPSNKWSTDPRGRGDYLIMNKQQTSISELLNLDWNAAEDLIQRSLNMLVNMVSMNNTYISMCYNMLVKCFIPREFTFTEERRNKYDLAFSEKISSFAHATIKQIISTVPLSVNTLYLALKDNYPHRRFDETVQWVFIKHALLVTYYCPSLTEPIFTLCVDKTITIDVEIKLEDIQDEEDEDDDAQFEFENEQPPKRTDNAKEDANKLDGMMAILFQYIDAVLGRGVKPPRPQGHALLIFPPLSEPPIPAEQFFSTLMHAFERVILNTHRSKYTQFLVFYACRLSALGSSQAYSQRFIAFLLGRLLDASTSRYLRIAVVAYLGSYVARATYLPVNLIKDTLAVLMDWAMKYLNTIDNNNTIINNVINNNTRRPSLPNNTNTTDNNTFTIDIDLHNLFYIVAQSMYYIFCFHHDSLLKMRGNDMSALAEGFRRVSQSKLNPYKVCLPTVVREFSRIVMELRWFDAEEILTRNERVIAPTKTSFGGANQLESFFPFDPYLLKYSSGCINELYNVWNGEEEEDADDSDDEEDTQESLASTDNSVANSMSGTPMSGTPVRSTSTTPVVRSLSRDILIPTPKETLHKRVDKVREEEEEGSQEMMSFTPEELRFHFSLDG